MTNIKTRLAGLAVAFFVVLTGLAFTTGSGAQAVANDQQEEVCYEQEAFQEYQFRNTVTTPTEITLYSWNVETRTEKFQHKYVKETRERTRDDRDDDWGPWSEWTIWDNGSTTRWEADGYTNEGDHDGNGNNGKYDRDYRYVKVVPSQTRPYTPPKYTDWVPAGTTSETTSPTPPSNTNTERFTGPITRTVPGEPIIDVLYYVVDGDPSALIGDASWTETNPGEPWEQFNEHTSERQVVVECPPVTTVPPTTQPPTTTEPPVTTVPPTTEPPVTTAPPTTEPPVVTTVPPTTQPPVVSIGTAPVPPAPQSGELPATGSNTTGLLLAIAAGTLGAGALLLVARRRKATI